MHAVHSTGFLSFFNDPQLIEEARGPTTVALVSGLMYLIFRIQPLFTLAIGALAMAAVAVARKALGRYDFWRAMERWVVIQDSQTPGVLPTIMVASLLASFVFPWGGCIVGGAVGVLYGLTYRARLMARATELLAEQEL